MGPTICPIMPSFAADVGDVDLSKPLSSDAEAAIKRAFWTYAVLVFPDQQLDADQHLAFARRFGPLEMALQIGRTGDRNLRLRPELVDPSDLDADNGITAKDSRLWMTQLANRLWHTDSSFRKMPAQASLLYSRSVAPIGGHTEFADLRAAWDALPAAMQLRVDLT